MSAHVPMALPSPLDAAIALHQQGALDEAFRAYQAILATDPQQADTLHLLGVVAHQRGDSQHAVRFINQAIGLCPSVAAYHANLAEAYRTLNQLDRAIGCCRTAERLDPSSAEAANNLGLVLLQQGKVKEAKEKFEAALRFKPDLALACNNLANCWRLLGNQAQAIVHFRQALSIAPNLPEAHSNLGQLLMEQKEEAEALVHCRESIRLHPDAPEAHNNLGNVLRSLGQLSDARVSYAEALRLNPDLALTHCNMGQALQQEGKLNEAILWYQQALDLDPDSARAHTFLGGALEEQEKFEEAASHYARACQIEPGFADARNCLGWVRHEQGQFVDALNHYREALRLEPDFPAAQCNLAHALQELGRFSEAEQLFRDVIARHPRRAAAHAQLATMRRDRLPEADQQSLQALLLDPRLGDAERMNLYFALAHVLDARGAFDSAADCLRQANAAARQSPRCGKYDSTEHDLMVDNLRLIFDTRFFAKMSGYGLDTEQPVFIFGLPRSGTTLTEQILASHSRVFGAGELRLARDSFFVLAGAQPPGAGRCEQFDRLDRDAVQDVARRHLKGLQTLQPTADRIVDKMPDNYLHLGLLAVLFPRAKFIHCRRDPRDVATSCWMTNFRHIRWASDPDHIAARFAAYERLMALWRETLPVPVLEVSYEETVADLECVARRMVDWCGLEWQPACLVFHEGQRAIRTASITQVRQPLYRHALGRWKHYEPALGALFSRLVVDRPTPENVARLPD